MNAPDSFLEQAALKARQEARRFAESFIAPISAEHDRSGTFPQAICQPARAAGILNLTVPSRFGGAGASALERAVVAEELAAACSGITAALQVHEVAALTIGFGGTEAQKQRFFGQMVNGELFGFAATERDAGSDLGSIACRATRKGSTYVLSGVKSLVSNIEISQHFVVLAKTEPDAGLQGLSAFVVPRNAAGLRVERSFEKLGQRASDTGEFTLQEVVIPEDNRLGNEGEGGKIALQVFAANRPCAAALPVGIAQRALSESIAYARERQTFGKPLWQHQALGHMMAQMHIDIEAARLLMLKSAWQVDHGVRDPATSAAAKTFASECATRICSQAIQIFGGWGYMREFPVEKLLRDAKACEIYEGTSQIQRNLIVRELFSRP